MNKTFIIILLFFTLFGCQKSQNDQSLSGQYLQSQITTTVENTKGVETQFITVGGNKIAYRKLGENSKVPLLLLQRFRGTMDDWDPAFVNGLAKDRTVIVFNNTGVASSTGTTPVTMKEAADDAISFAKALGYNKIDIAGWSMAGFTVQIMAMDYPDYINSVVMIGTGPPGSKEETSETNIANIFEVATIPEYSDNDHEVLFFTNSKKGKAAREASLARIRSNKNGNLEAPSTPETMQNQVQAIVAYRFEGKGNYFDRIKTIQQPTLIVSGDRDAFFDVKAQWLLHREIPNSQLLIFPMAGHGSHHEYPDLATNFINEFLNENLN